jgi:hypothetical protein
LTHGDDAHTAPTYTSSTDNDDIDDTLKATTSMTHADDDDAEDDFDDTNNADDTTSAQDETRFQRQTTALTIRTKTTSTRTHNVDVDDAFNTTPSTSHTARTTTH